MFRMWRRWFLFTVQVVAVLATAFLGLYQYIVKPENVSWRVESAFLLAIFILTVIGAYYTYINPIREMNAFVLAVLDTHAQHIVDSLKAQNIDVRLNVAVACIYPFQWAWPLRRFKIVWDCGMKYAPDAASAFPVSKGVAGEAYRRRKDTLVNMEVPANADLAKWGFSKKEASYFPKFTVVWSFPVFRLGPGDRPTQKICGMLNLDSTSVGAFNVLISHPEIRKLLEELRELLCKLSL